MCHRRKRGRLCSIYANNYILGSKWLRSARLRLQQLNIALESGGRTTKIHAAVDGNGHPLNLVLTGGEVHDSRAVEATLDVPHAPLLVAADKAYDSENILRQIRDEGALPAIPSRSTALKKAWCPKHIYRRRHKIENFFCALKITAASLRATTSSP
jgi:transposase